MAGGKSNVSFGGAALADSNGGLEVSIESKSQFLANTLPVEIRNASGELVLTSSCPILIDVPAGLYRVSATLTGGLQQTEIVSVTADHRTEVRLRPPVTAVVEIHAPEQVEEIGFDPTSL